MGKFKFINKSLNNGLRYLENQGITALSAATGVDRQLIANAESKVKKLALAKKGRKKRNKQKQQEKKEVKRQVLQEVSMPVVSASHGVGKILTGILNCVKNAQRFDDIMPLVSVAGNSNSGLAVVAFGAPIKLEPRCCYARGTFYSQTVDGYFGIGVHPLNSITTDRGSIYMTSASTNSSQKVDPAATVEKLTTGGYPQATFVNPYYGPNTGGGFEGFPIMCILRVRYMGTVFDQGGLICGARAYSDFGLASADLDEIQQNVSCYRELTFDGEWKYALWINNNVPMVFEFPNDSSTPYFEIAGTTTSSSTDTADPPVTTYASQPFQYELYTAAVYGGGNNISSQKPWIPDVAAYQAICAAALQNPSVMFGDCNSNDPDKLISLLSSYIQKQTYVLESSMAAHEETSGKVVI